MITLNGITYEVLGEKRITGYANRFEITLRRPQGRRAYHAVRYEDGSISSVA